MTVRLLSTTAFALCAMSATVPTASASVDFPTRAIVLAQYQELDVSRGVPTVVPEASIDTGIERGDATDVEQDNSVISKPYTWTLTLADGGVAVRGYVPAPAFQRYLAVKSSMPVQDESDVREGAPNGFVEDALAALEGLRLLVSGTAGLDETGWFVEGELADGHNETDIIAALASGVTRAGQWRIDVVRVGPSDALATEIEEEPAVVDESPEVGQLSTSEAAVEELGEKSGETDAAPEFESVVDLDVEAKPVSEPEPDPDSAAEAEAEPEAAAQLATDFEPDSSVVRETVGLAPSFRFSATKGEDGSVDLVGDATEDFLQAIGDADGFNSESLSTQWDAPAGFSAAANAGLAALALLDSGQVILRDGVWLLSGNARTDYVKNSVLGILQSQAPETEWKTLILAQPSLDVCREEVAAYITDNPILFPSAGIVPTPASLASLSGLAEIFALCPEAQIYVEGHTDADGTAEANLSLSIRRAEAVVDALVELGVESGRLFAVGYGAGLPIASNATSEGKRQNRRIVFSFEDIARPIP